MATLGGGCGVNVVASPHVTFAPRFAASSKGADSYMGRCDNIYAAAISKGGHSDPPTAARAYYKPYKIAGKCNPRGTCFVDAIIAY